jgi:alanine racemase
MDARDALGEPTATISRSALLHNAAVVRRAVGRTVKICATIKANAYGHDAGLVADALANFSTNDFGTPSVDAFAVADLDEAAALPEVVLPILVLRPVENCFVGRQRARVEMAVRHGWWLTVATPTAANDVARIAAATGKRAHVHVMVDTGMGRGGVGPGDLEVLLDRIERRSGSLRLAGLYTHFANGEDPDHPLTIEQLATFLDRTDGAAERSGGRLIRHAAASGAVFFTRPAHLDMVRPGLALYGIDPTGRPSIDRPLRPVLRWTAPLIGIRDVPAGATVGYGQTWRAERPTRVGLIPVGYADGYHRAYGNRAVTLVHGCPAPVVGRVSMDLTTIDLSQVPAAAVGDEVVLLDSDPISPCSVYRLAEWSDTIPYEVLCRIGPRVRRVGIDPADVREPVAAASDDAEWDQSAE